MRKHLPMNQDYFIVREGCPVCKKSNLEKLCRIPYSSNEMVLYLKSFYDPQGGIKDFTIFNNVYFELVHCKTCDLIFQKNIPSHILMRLLYEEFIDSEVKKDEIKNSKRYDLNYYKKISTEIDFLVQMTKLNPAKIKFLDYGMGWGLLGNMAKAYGCDAYGTELSQSKKEYAASNGIKVVEDKELDKMRFDIINISDVLEHIEDPSALIECLLKCLNPSGIFRLSVPYERNILKDIGSLGKLSLLDKRLNSIAPLEHINCFSPLTLKFLADKNNLLCRGTMDLNRLIDSQISINRKIKFFIKKEFFYQYYSSKSTNLVFQRNNL